MSNLQYCWLRSETSCTLNELQFSISALQPGVGGFGLWPGSRLATVLYRHGTQVGVVPALLHGGTRGVGYGAARPAASNVPWGGREEGRGHGWRGGGADARLHWQLNLYTRLGRAAAAVDEQVMASSSVSQVKTCNNQFVHICLMICSGKKTEKKCKHAIYC